jgi:hypothetical protein
MRSSIGACIVLLLSVASAATAFGDTNEPQRSFSTVRIEIDSGPHQLSGWQLRADFGKSGARIVGIEGGDAVAFSAPPHYDPRALNAGEIILAALAASKDLPTGRTTVAVLHVEHYAPGLPPLELSEWIAIGPDGQPIEASVVPQNGAER